MIKKNNAPEYLLLPANPWFIAFSLALAVFLNLLPWGRVLGLPDYVALVLLFWNLHQPRKVGMTVAFSLGLLMDVHQANLLGEHALAYPLLSYVAIALHRRVQCFGSLGQAFHVLPLLMLAHMVPFIIRLFMGAVFPGWLYIFSGFVEALLWPVVRWILLAPQRRAANPDDTRPI